MNFDEFTKSLWYNHWIDEEGHLKMYVRRTPPRFKHRWGNYQLASMSNEIAPGKGALKKFLDKYEPTYQFYIENLLNPQLAVFFLKRGYRIVSGDHAPCMMGPDPNPGEENGHVQ
jgi:hypothetical protein